MIRKTWKMVALAGVFGLACSDNNENADGGHDGAQADVGGGDVPGGVEVSGGDGTTGGDGTGGDGGGTPAAPRLGTQIDRMGRPAINTALTSPFVVDMTAKDMAKDDYNKALPATWSTFTNEIAVNLATVDGLDQMCGNQLLAGMTAAAGRYDTLAGALGDDRLYLRSDATACTQYLAVELNATRVMTNSDCGGRTPLYDVIDTTYSVLATGMLTGVTDGIAADDKTPSATTFPFLAEPN